MKKLLALLATLFLGPAMAQEIIPGPYVPPPIETPNLIYTTLNPAPEGTQYQWSGFIPNNTGGGGLQGGNIPAYNSLTGTFIFGYTQGNINYNLSNSPEWPNSNGFEVNGFKYSFEYFNQDFSRGTLSVGFNFRAPNQSVLESFGLNLPQTINGWTTVEGIYAFSHPYDRPDIGSIQFTLSGKDDRFWAGYYGPQIRDVDLNVLYNPVPPPPPGFLYWTSLAGEYGTFTLTETTTVRYGGEGSYIYATLEAGTYACNNFEWGRDPAGGIGKSCEAGTNIDPDPPQTDCTLYPTDPNCAVLVYTDPELIADEIVDDIVADVLDTTDDTNTGNDDGSDDGAELIEEEEEKTFVAYEDIDEADLEEMLQDEETNEEVIVEEANEREVAYRELTDEEKAQILADSISKSALEFALSVAENTATTTATTVETTTSTTSRSSNNDGDAKSDEKVFDTNESIEQVADNSTDNMIDLLENGRSMGIAALSITMAQTEQSANDSISQAENIAMSSSEIKSTDNTAIESIGIENVIDTSNVANNNGNDFELVVEENKVETVVEEVVANNIEQSVTDSTDTIDSFTDIMNIEIKPTDTSTDDVKFVQNVLAQIEQKSEDTSVSSFEEDEKVTIQNDPNLANAFNVLPNVTNLEIMGVLNNKQEEKTDAEKKADQVVAANKEQQDEINKNYMDADQSGIVAAMGADTDVNSYRSAMLNDNNIWYKPEDIYKNVVYKDNVRGAYFLEKGNTDTYKKMVADQYK